MLLIFGCWVLLHFALYVLVLRQHNAFQRERVIFLYHLLPAIGVTVLVGGILLIWPTSSNFLKAVSVLALQGCYSLTFLELWSLSQIGYSIDILMRCDTARARNRSFDATEFERVGAGKKAERLEGLLRLGLATPGVRGYRLSRSGKVLAGCLQVIRSLSSHREAE